MSASPQARVEGLLHARRGHFAFESGHHGDLWLDLELLCLDPAPVRGLAAELAERLRPHAVQAVCGPLNEGAFVALFVAEALDVPFTYTERVDTRRPGLYPVAYPLPAPLQPVVRGRRVALVNDVVNAGSAVRGSCRALVECGASPVALGTLLVLGEVAARLASEGGLALEALASLEHRLFEPARCPLCRAGVALEGAGRAPEEPGTPP